VKVSPLLAVTFIISLFVTCQLGLNFSNVKVKGKVEGNICQSPLFTIKLVALAPIHHSNVVKALFADLLNIFSID